MRTVVRKVDEYKVGGEPGNPEIHLAQDWDVYYIIGRDDPPSILHDFGQSDAYQEFASAVGVRATRRFQEWEMVSHSVLRRHNLYLKGDVGAVVFSFIAYLER